MDYMDPMPSVLKKADKLNLSLSLSLSHYLSTLEILQPYTKPLSFSCFASDFQKTYIGGLAQERHNSIALAMELCLSCTNPSICTPANKA